MSWHTLSTKTTTFYPAWYYHAHIIVPMELILNYEVRTLYLLKTSFAKKPKHPV